YCSGLTALITISAFVTFIVSLLLMRAPILHLNGITMATALISALTGIPVSKEVGMTGEITLRGRVLPIGGLKEKTLSAHRAGLTKIILPAENEKDLDDIPESVKENLTFVLASHLDEVLEHALVGVKQ
ncbi:S16 family serine protease, partial [Bacillus cereus]